MSAWVFIVCATAFGGALLVWHMVSRTKHVSDEMLDKYSEMLQNVREERAKKLAAEGDDENVGDDGVIEV